MTSDLDEYIKGKSGDRTLINKLKAFLTYQP
jgi:hypothetical protein